MVRDEQTEISVTSNPSNMVCSPMSNSSAHSHYEDSGSDSCTCAASQLDLSDQDGVQAREALNRFNDN